MSDSSPSAAIVTIRSDETMLERLALVGLWPALAGIVNENRREEL